MSRTPDRPDHPPFEEEKVQAAMPFPLQPTNLPGAYTTPAPPDDFDPYTASPRDLVRAGFLWRRPDAASRPEFREAWDLVMSRQWRREDRIVPTFEVRPGRTHHLRQRPVKEANGLYKFGNWAGAGKNGGNWSTVIGFWQVPAVSVPPEGPGPDGGRDSASWIGIDGFLGSTDVLQAGTSQNVDAQRNSYYSAWFERYVPPPNRDTFPPGTQFDGNGYPLSWVGAGGRAQYIYPVPYHELPHERRGPDLLLGSVRQQQQGGIHNNRQWYQGNQFSVTLAPRHRDVRRAVGGMDHGEAGWKLDVAAEVLNVRIHHRFRVRRQ